ncbi:MAG: hypothetical protein LBD95_00015, partial [Clostridiales Family XIII bacterium]|nr:hypothetical protein [Clostridiales Family XIII bacterium]
SLSVLSAEAELRDKKATLGFASFLRSPAARFAVRFSIAAKAAEKRQHSASPRSSARFTLFAVRFVCRSRASGQKGNPNVRFIP